MAEFEKRITVMAGADAAFEALSDPVRLPDYVPIIELVDSVGLDGAADLDADLEEREGAPDAAFFADRKTRRIAWGNPDAGYGGSIEIEAGTSLTSAITVRLRTRDDLDQAAAQRVFDESLAKLRQVVARR